MRPKHNNETRISCDLVPYHIITQHICREIIFIENLQDNVILFKKCLIIKVIVTISSRFTFFITSIFHILLQLPEQNDY